MNRLLALCCFLLLCVACTPLQGQAVGELRLDDPWARATPPGTTVSGGFLTVRNLGDRDDRLVEVRSSASREVQIHEVRSDGGMMRMRPLVNGLVIPAGASVSLQPGGYHLMFLQPQRPFAGGDVVVATLVFEHAGDVEVSFQVRGEAARDAAGAHAHH